jgi:hypothetical protein
MRCWGSVEQGTLIVILPSSGKANTVVTSETRQRFSESDSVSAASLPILNPALHLPPHTSSVRADLLLTELTYVK